MSTQQALRDQGEDYGLFERVKEARDWFQHRVKKGARVRVVGDDDSDGVSSAFVLAHALRRAGYKVEVTIRPIHTEADVKAAVHGRFDAFLIADAGSALLETVDQCHETVLVLDHHAVGTYEPKHAFEVNPRRVGGERTWSVSASTVCTLFAAALSEQNWDLAYAGLCGAISDRQHLGGFGGLVGFCLGEADRVGNVVVSNGLTLDGATTLDAISNSLDPYFAPYTGNPDGVRSLLEDLGIDASTDPCKLPEAHARRLAERLTEQLQTRGVVTDRMFPLFGVRPLLRHPSGVPTLTALAKLLEAATAADKPQLAIAILDGDAKARAKVEEMAETRRARIMTELDRMKGEIHDMRNLRWVESKDGANTGVYGHTLLTYVCGDDRPLLVLAKNGRRVRVSSRGSPRLFLAGVNLATAMAQVAPLVGGAGGGHPGAAGATIPAAKLDEFLADMDRVIGALRHGKAE